MTPPSDPTVRPRRTPADPAQPDRPGEPGELRPRGKGPATPESGEPVEPGGAGGPAGLGEPGELGEPDDPAQPDNPGEPAEAAEADELRPRDERPATPGSDELGEPDDPAQPDNPGEPAGAAGAAEADELRPRDERPATPGSDEPVEPGGAGGLGEPLFLGDGAAGAGRLRMVADRVVEAVERWAVGGAGAGPCSDLAPGELAALVAGLHPCPDEAVPLDRVLDEIGERVLAHGVRPWDPACAAHLHCPPLLTAAATELAIGTTNQSMDSYDQAPAATFVEDHLVGWLAGLVGLPAGATGVLTAGGTASNLLGLTLAREHAGDATRDGHASWRGRASHAGDHGQHGHGDHGGHDDQHGDGGDDQHGDGGDGGHGHGSQQGAGSVAQGGLPSGADGWRIVASAGAHFSVERAAAVLGLGRHAVVPVDVDDHGRMDIDALDATLACLDGAGLTTIALVGTAGTTDAGAVDPLGALADRAGTRGAWFHVDAAVGGALCLSDRLRPLVAGIERADSITTDLHKLWFQPIGASALLVRDPGAFGGLHRHSDYLDRADDGETGVLNLVRRSLDTSRRFDALKVLVSLRSTGRRRMATLVEHLVDTARRGALEVVDRHPDLELLAPPSTVTVLFRWHPAGGPPLDDRVLDAANTAIQRRLFAGGRAVLGRTRWDGRVALKLTLVNPRTTVADLGRLADLVTAEGTATLQSPPAPLEVVR